jgi:hypothetical protein
MKKTITKNDWELCKCKNYFGYTREFICLSCHKHIHDSELQEKIDIVLESDSAWKREFYKRFVYAGGMKNITIDNLITFLVEVYLLGYSDHARLLREEKINE